MLKRLLAAALLLLALPALALAEAGPIGTRTGDATRVLSAAATKKTQWKTVPAQYEAYVFKDTLMRATPKGKRVETLKKGTKIYVMEWGKDWCKVQWQKQNGYAETKKLVRFRSLDATKYPVPGRTVNAGIVTMETNTTIKGGKFNGMKATPGTVVCVTEAGDTQYRLAVWRGSGAIGRERGAYQPFVSWEEAQPGDLIGGFTTFYNKQLARTRAKEREHNITLACKRLNGSQVQAGKSFSFNQKCGRYTQGNKYQLAPNISATGLGYGGGVCQVSTTLYNAVLGLPLQVDSVRVHRDSGVAYVPQWFDSAVSAYSNLIFTNSLPYPIRIWAQPQGGALTVLIYRAGEPAAMEAAD